MSEMCGWLDPKPNARALINQLKLEKIVWAILQRNIFVVPGDEMCHYCVFPWNGCVEMIRNEIVPLKTNWNWSFELWSLFRAFVRTEKNQARAKCRNRKQNSHYKHKVLCIDQCVCVCVSLQSVFCVMSGGWFAAELRAQDVELHTIDAVWLSAEAATIAIECSTKRDLIWNGQNCIAECLQEMSRRENDYHLFFPKSRWSFFSNEVVDCITWYYRQTFEMWPPPPTAHQQHNYSKFVRN